MFIILLVFNFGKLNAQDLIVTLKNDSIDCKLIEFNKFDTITYAFYNGGIKITKKIASNEIEKILTNFYVVKSQVSQDSMELAQVKKSYYQ
jgi:hypothetical protein